ncbi:MAG: helix-hairpin-helix domain-containing protein [Planctomycetia bacterium]
MPEYCETHAVGVFARNLRNLLLQPPVPGRRVLALDPGFKSGCKAVVIDECGTPLEHAVLHIIGQQERRAEAGRKIVDLVGRHGCSVVAIGNGTAGRETESLVAELVAGELQSLDVAYVMVNEAGASVYSTSQYGREELPQHEAAVRGAISIGRRLQDPLSELVKIEPANIGVGLYQHDVKARHLHASLDHVVESCENYVGVDLNTASPALLRYVSGLNQATAKNIHEWRMRNGPFTFRRQLLEVPGFGEAAYVQAAGFLKIAGGAEPLDATWIHPESYPVAEKVLARLGGGISESAPGERGPVVDLQGLAEEFGVGRLLLADIIEQLSRPGRDPREDLPKPVFKKGVLKFDDLEVGMELLGPVLNVVDFGAFVDIGMHDSGLVHISQLSGRYVRDPHDVVSVGQVVKVWVLELDKARRRVALTMISPAERARQQLQEERKRESRGRKRASAAKQAAPRAKAPGGTSPPAAAAREAAGGGNRDRQQRSPPPAGQPRRGRGRPPREQGARTYVSRGPNRPAAPLSAAMRDGKEPLRTFSDLLQFYSARSEEGTDEKPAAGQPATGKQAGPAPTEEPPTAPGT